MKKNVLRQCIYDLYKQEWIHSHVSNQQIKDNIVDYYEGLVDLPEDYTYEDYIEEYGYNGGDIYACYEEFLNMEYKDIEFIEPLLKDYPKLFEEYKKDLEEIFK